MAIKRKSKSTYGICRVDSDSKRTHGWMVTVQRRNKIHRKFFSDQKCGSREDAFTAARNCRDQIIARHKPMPLKQYVNIERRNNRTGFVGVCRYAGPRTNGPSGYWVAYWTLPDGKRKRAKFSVMKYGENEAFTLAVQARRQAVRDISGDFDPGKNARVRGR